LKNVSSESSQHCESPQNTGWEFQAEHQALALTDPSWRVMGIVQMKIVGVAPSFCEVSASSDAGRVVAL